MYSLGIDIGYSSVKLVISCQNEIIYSFYKPHKGKISETLLKALDLVDKEIGISKIQYLGITGNVSKFFRKKIYVTQVNEIASTIEGVKATNNNFGSIIEIGGESSKYITNIKGDNFSPEISINSNCAAGTGSFIEEQVSRLGINLEDYSKISKKYNKIPRIAGRCSVFAKTDITHHIQEGVPISDILMGLSFSLIQNYKNSIVKSLKLNKKICFIGGVAFNDSILYAIKKIFNLVDSEIEIPDNFSTMTAYGASLIAERSKYTFNINEFKKTLKEFHNIFDLYHGNQNFLKNLSDFDIPNITNKHLCSNKNDDDKFYIGIDIGSTSTNIIVMNELKEITDFDYVKTLGNPVKALKDCFKKISKNYKKDDILGVGVTGSGRYLIGNLIGSDVIKDEITSQAKAAIEFDKDVDTVFEIGGQDSKYISISNGKVIDFQMNKICAAGTGSFIEEQSKKFNIDINNLGDIALESTNPIDLGERCTVFIESSISSHLSAGSNLRDISAGLCYSIVRNYINRVVGNRKIGNKILLQGGIAYNKGIINAFKSITKKTVEATPFFSVTGAYGVALLTKEELKENTKFKGFDIDNYKINPSKKNNTKLEISHFYDEVSELIFENYKSEIDSTKKTVGIPRALFTFGMFPMFNAIFKNLGLNVVLSEPTNEKTIKLAQKYSLDEICYPIKLINGHVAELINKKVDYIFFPDLHTVDHPGSQSRQNYGCAYMQLAFKIINHSMDLEKYNIELLSPTFAFNRGKEFMMKSFIEMGKKLNKTPEETMKAVNKGMLEALNFEKKLQENSLKTLNDMKKSEKAFVLISKIYGIADPALNLRIPDKLIKMGYKIIPFYNMPEADIFFEHPNMFWPFGQHILEPAKIIRENPNLHAILLTHHCCGPDSILNHYFKELMEEKTYLNIEVDEHSSEVGIITRIEAFINSIEKKESYKKRKSIIKRTNIVEKFEDKEKPIIIPNIFPYSYIFSKVFTKYDLNIKVLPETNKESINIGRKFTTTNEYLSLTALTGDVFKYIQNDYVNKEGYIFFPQNEGSEVDGQYSRFLRYKLDENKYNSINILSPFIEDILKIDDENMIEDIFNSLLLGDIINHFPHDKRDVYLKKFLDKKEPIDFEEILVFAKSLYIELKNRIFKKDILIVGEPLILFNKKLNNFLLSDLEKENYRIIYSPLSEYLYIKWYDCLYENQKKEKERLSLFKNKMIKLNNILKETSPFEKNIDTLIEIANNTVGYYEGSFGRYREGKCFSENNNYNGIIALSSTYENTGITLNILHKKFSEKYNGKPLLNLTFDGNKNDIDNTKLKSFLYYLK